MALRVMGAGVGRTGREPVCDRPGAPDEPVPHTDDTARRPADPGLLPPA